MTPTYHHHLLLLTLTLTPLLASTTPTKRIVGGQKATPNQFPSLVVSLSALSSPGSTNHYQFCGGSLLNPTTVLTAAHCVDWVLSEPAGFNVRAGSLLWATGGLSANVSSYVQHPKYNASTTDHDFAVLKLATTIEADGESIEYAALEDSPEDPVAGTEGVVAGWGLDSDGGYRRPDLYYVQVPVVGREVCEKDFEVRGVGITEDEFCAGVPEGGKGIARGTVGGRIISGER